MYISRIVIRNFRNFEHLDIQLSKGVTCIVGENNTGKTNLLHGLRLAIDTGISSRYRILGIQDIHSGVDLSHADQVLVSVEYKDYEAEVNQQALVGEWSVGDDTARISYRFRPRRTIRQQIEDGDHDGTKLSLLDDYHFEVTGGGAIDPATVAWHEPLGTTIRFGDLQSYHVEYLRAMRDVQNSLKNNQDSPLNRIFNAGDFSDAERQTLETIVGKANEEIVAQPTIESTGQAIQESFDKVSGEAFPLNMKLGMSDPSFQNISQSLKLLLSNKAITNFEPSRNGLGLNNVLFIGLLLEYFDRRIKKDKTAGELLLIEEPESHLHPQLQRVLYSSLADRPFQTIITTHSTHISSQAPIASFIALTNDGSSATSGCVPKVSAGLSPEEESDLNRFLDATRSTLLYARKVMLVEGPAELFLIPMFAKIVMGIDLDRHGISVIPIHGTHFESYTKLFGEHGLKKQCVVVTDADLKVDDIPAGQEEDAHYHAHGKKSLENKYVSVFACPVTFERAYTLENSIPMLIKTIEECQYPKILAELKAKEFDLMLAISPQQTAEIMGEVRTIVLKSAKRCGKARFAQIASKYVEPDSMPGYIRNAIEWLVI